MKIAELADEAGLLPGVCNVANGGRTVVNRMLDHPDIEGITFVGSIPIAKDVIYPRCGATGKWVIAQGGASDFMVIMAHSS
jgi:malonate-semialdehyde dehydrogenase (acetylating)/methylmalonate-semialdehyde dehydrogenase